MCFVRSTISFHRYFVVAALATLSENDLGDCLRRLDLFWKFHHCLEFSHIHPFVVEVQARIERYGLIRKPQAALGTSITVS